MKKLTLLLFVALLFSCNDDDEPLPAPDNTFNLVIDNKNSAFQLYKSIELTGHNLTIPSSSLSGNGTTQIQTFEIDGSVIKDIENKIRLTDVNIKLNYECKNGVGEMSGTPRDHEVVVNFLEQTPTTTIEITRDTEGWSQFFKCRHNITITYN